MITGNDRKHPDAAPHDHAFWRGKPCPVCCDAETQAEQALRPAKKPEDCKHEDFAARVGVARLEDTGTFCAEVSVWCKECGLPFSFTGLPLAISTSRANVNIDATEVRLPIEPGPKPIPVSGTIPVEMPRRSES